MSKVEWFEKGRGVWESGGGGSMAENHTRSKCGAAPPPEVSAEKIEACSAGCILPVHILYDPHVVRTVEGGYLAFERLVGGAFKLWRISKKDYQRLVDTT